MIENLQVERGLLPSERHLPGARSRGDAAAEPRRARRECGRSVHGQRRQRAHRPRAARVAVDRRRSAGAEPGLSAVDRGREFESRPRGSLSVSARERFRARPERHRSADHQPHARHRRHQSEQSDRRGVFARDAGGHRADRRAASPGRVLRRDLRPDPLRRRRVRADGDARARHAVRDALRLVEGLSCLRLSRRLGSVLGRRRARARVSRARWTSCRRCACAATFPANGRCRLRSAATRASTS